MSVKAILDFEYHAPETVEEAIELLAEYKGDAKIFAGGTDMIPKMKAHVMCPAHIISLKNIKELKFVNYDEKEGLSFGAATPIRKVENYAPVKEIYPALYEGIHCIASTQIRNAGTVVGNLINAVPSADSAPASLVLEAVLHVVSKRGERKIPVNNLFTGVCRTCLEPDELVTKVTVPVPAKNSGSHYIPFTVRRAMDLSMVGVAANVTMEGNICKDIKIALGAVATTPKRAAKAEAMLIGNELTDELLEEAAVVASQEDCAPITDMRATREYRIELVRVLTRDAVKEAVSRIK